MHWTRLPPPIVPNQNPSGVPQNNWYDAHGSFDGSLSVPNEWNGLTEPVVVMTAVEGSKPPASRAEWLRVGAQHPDWYSIGMAIVRPTNASDPFLASWTKDAANPVAWSNGTWPSPMTPYDTPGQVWKNGDHWNFLILGNRYTTTDATFHSWGLAPGDKFINAGENGGQWFSKLANLKDGSPPPAGSPGWMMNVGGGQRYQLGNYDEKSETWTSVGPISVIDSGPDAKWMAGQFAGDRFMNIGWSTGGPPMGAVAEYPHEDEHEDEHDHEHGYSYYASVPSDTAKAEAAAAGSCTFTDSWEVFADYTNIYGREPSPTNATHGTLLYIGMYDSTDECFAAVNASTRGPFHSFTYNNASVAQPYGRHCWADTSMTWQGRGNAFGQSSGRGPGFPLPTPLPPSNRFTHDHLGGLREVAYEPETGALVSNPVRELTGLRNGTLGSDKDVVLKAGTSHVVVGTGAPADASASDVVVRVAVPPVGAAAGAAVGVTVLANLTAEGSPFGGVLAIVNFTAPDTTDGTIKATASIRTLNPCGTGSAGLSQVTFPILKGETTLDLRVLVDRSIVEVFFMGGRAVFSKTFNPAVLYVPDTHVVLQAWGADLTVGSVDVFSMGCGWADPPYQPNPTLDSISGPATPTPPPSPPTPPLTPPPSSPLAVVEQWPI